MNTYACTMCMYKYKCNKDLFKMIQIQIQIQIHNQVQGQQIWENIAKIKLINYDHEGKLE